MGYAELLAWYIKESGKSLREIEKACDERGVKVDHTYISKLKNGRLPPPSDEVNKVLAEVLGCDLEVLILAAYEAKIPPAVLHKLIQRNK